MLSWFRRRPAPARRAPALPRFQPALDNLEDRTTPTVSAITGNFNGTAIAAGNVLWLSSVAKVSNVPATGAIVHVGDQTVSFTANGVPYSIAVPDSTLTLSPGTTNADTATNADGSWSMASPRTFSGNVFLSGVAVPLPSGLPGGIKNVTWSGDFVTNAAGVKVNWQWAGAAYSNFGATNADVLGVKAADNGDSTYMNADHAGTPENFKSFVRGGATGGGGSNFTGSLSATKSVIPEVGNVNPPVEVSPAGISGFVRDRFAMPQAQVLLTLTGTDDRGQTVSVQTYTDSNGRYEFINLRPGTYTITETPPDLSADFLTLQSATSEVGQINNGAGSGTSGTNGQIVDVTLAGGDIGTDFNFVNVYVRDL
ncbi:MAG: carboxypeptidase regulatory-like domain-containing protein [Gemmataceae bacterium]